MNVRYIHRNIICCLLTISILLTGRILPAKSVVADALDNSPNLNPNSTIYPDSSLVDRSSLLDAPAGKHGFVIARDGHFYFSDGKRARFYGVNLAKNTVFIEKTQIDYLVNLFARAGINLVRIHHIDDVQGIIDTSNPEEFRNDKLDIVDYWIAKLKEKGIYLCLDLNDYRTFYESEGVINGEKLGRGAKPYAVFDQHLIELQLDYAKRFLADHVNPYTKLSYANDPAIALLEIYDENGLFIRSSEWVDLKEPYKTQLKQQWNAWLRYKYGSTAGLKIAWSNRDGASALAKGESLEQATVKLPQMDLLFDPPKGVSNPLQAPARVSDGAVFAFETQRNFMQIMRNGLRDLGVKIPITAVGGQHIIPDVMTTTSVDYIGINFYWDHPAWNNGKDWKEPYYFSLQNPIISNVSYSFPPWVSISRAHGKPLVVRELGYCYPNPYRGFGMIESAAYGAFLDIDALILFTYDNNRENKGLSYFDIHLDPLRWGLVSQASRLFLSGEVKPANTATGIGYSDVDAFTWKSYASSLYQLAFSTRVENYFTPGVANPFDLLISSGRSIGASWKGERLLLFANQRHTDIHYQGIADGMDVKHGYNFQTGNGGQYDFTFRGIGYDAGSVRSVLCWPPYQLASLQAKKVQPIAIWNNLALGFIDPPKKVIGFRNLQENLAIRVALDALRDWSGAKISHSDLDQSCWRTDTGQITRDFAAKMLRVDTPKFQTMAGNFETPAALRTSNVNLTTPTTMGTLTVESLDDQPLSASSKFLVKMTSRARNDQMNIQPANDGPKEYKLVNAGNTPISTDGKASASPTRITINGKPLIEIGMQDGCWEYLVEPGHALLYLDTNNVTVKLPEHPALVRFYKPGGKTTTIQPDESSFTIPAGSVYAEIIWGKS